MEPVYILLLPIFIFAVGAGGAKCEGGWQAYNEEVCIRTFPTTFLTYNEAKSFCSSQSVENAKASLVMVKEAGMQELLVNTTSDIYDNMWLGGRYDDEAGDFKWDDGEPLSYTNWVEGSPRNDSDSSICIDMRPINAKQNKTPQGKWTDVNCNKRNLVTCQRILQWTFQDAINEIIKMRKQLLEATQERNELSERLEAVSSRVVPVGSIYIEYYSQPSPASLWPDLEWDDVSSLYAGLFFRASGGDAASWGANQDGCAPRITEMNYLYGVRDINQTKNPLNIPMDGWSEAGLGGESFGPGVHYYERLQFNSLGCEVRPKNQAVRIWKRVA